MAALALLPAAGRCTETARAAPAAETVRLTGYTRARHIMDLVSQASGTCLTVAGDVGDVLGPEGVFAELDRTFIDLDLEQNQVRQERLRIEIAYQRTKARRLERLVSRDLADQDSLDQQQNRLDTARKDLELARVQARDLRERRRRHTITASPGWTIVERLLEPGEWVRSGEVVGRAGDYRSLLVPFSLAPEELATLRQRAGRLELVLPHQGESGLRLPASIETVSPAFDPETRKVRVELLLDQGGYEQRGGQLAELVLRIPDPGGAVLLPERALRSSYEEHWLLRANGERVPVVLLERLGEQRVKVRSESLHPGQSFQLRPAP